MILLTGATGFIGRSLCSELVRRGHKLRILVRDPKAYNEVERPDSVQVVYRRYYRSFIH